MLFELFQRPDETEPGARKLAKLMIKISASYNCPGVIMSGIVRAQRRLSCRQAARHLARSSYLGASLRLPRFSLLFSIES